MVSNQRLPACRSGGAVTTVATASAASMTGCGIRAGIDAAAQMRPATTARTTCRPETCLAARSIVMLV